jgi:hypothetical protein
VSVWTDEMKSAAMADAQKVWELTSLNAELEAALRNALDLLEQKSFRDVPGSPDEREDYNSVVSQAHRVLQKSE